MIDGWVCCKEYTLAAPECQASLPLRAAQHLLNNLHILTLSLLTHCYKQAHSEGDMSCRGKEKPRSYWKAAARRHPDGGNRFPHLRHR